MFNLHSPHLSHLPLHSSLGHMHEKDFVDGFSAQKIFHCHFLNLLKGLLTQTLHTHHENEAIWHHYHSSFGDCPIWTSTIPC